MEFFIIVLCLVNLGLAILLVISEKRVRANKRDIDDLSNDLSYLINQRNRDYDNMVRSFGKQVDNVQRQITTLRIEVDSFSKRLVPLQVVKEGEQCQSTKI